MLPSRLSYGSCNVSILQRARRCRHSGAECLVEYEGLMVCTLSHWIPPESNLPWVPVPEFTLSTSTVGWELLLHPLDVMLPSPRNHRRCRANSAEFNLASSGSPQSYRISAYDINEVKALGNETLYFKTSTCSWELQCHSRNSHDLLFACLSAQVKCVHDERTVETFSDTSASTETEEDENIESLTDRCIRDSLRRESFGDKLERRWGKAVNDIQDIVTGAAV